MRLWDNRGSLSLVFDLNAAACFIEVARHASFIEAARRLGMPASTLSRKVQRLEDELGVRLLERTTRHVRPTEAGDTFFRRAAAALDELERARIEVLDLGSELTGEIRVSFPPNHVEVVTQVMLEFQAVHPRVRLTGVATDRIVDMVREGFDVAIRVGRSPDDLGGKDFAIRRLLRYRHVLCASPAYLDEHGTPDTLEDLSHHRCIGWSNSAGPITWPLHGPGDERVVCHPNAVLRFNDYLAILDAACKGVGICELPSLFCHDELASATLIELLPAWRFAETSLYAVQPAVRLRRRVVEVFIQHCTTRLGARYQADRQ